MAVLLLDPAVLVVLAAWLGGVWWVWRGGGRRWFGRPSWWTALIWPGLLLPVVVPVAAACGLWLAASIGVPVGDGGIGDAAVYVTAYVAPAAGLLLWPPAWVLPAWARGQLTPVDRATVCERDGAVCAVHARRGHGSRGRWVWRVNGAAGELWAEGTTVRFRASSAENGGHEAHPAFEEDATAELRFSEGPELYLEPPRGGWWSRDVVDIELAEVDRIDLRARRPWANDGLLVVEVAGRRPLTLWVADARAVGMWVRGS